MQHQQQDEGRRSRFAVDPLQRDSLLALRERAASQPPTGPADPLSTRIELANKRYETAFGAPGTPPATTASPWTPGRSTFTMNGTTPGRLAPTRSLSFSTSQDLPSRFHPFIRESFPSTFEDDEEEDASTFNGETAQELYDSSLAARGSRAALLAADGSNRSRSQSLAATTRRHLPLGGLLPAPGSSGFAQSWGVRPSQPSGLGGGRYDTMGSSVAGGQGVSAVSRGLPGTGGTDLSNMSPFVRDVGQIRLEDGSVFKDPWGVSAALLRDDGGGSGTTSRRHSVSVVQQPRRGVAVGFSSPGGQNDSPPFGDVSALNGLGHGVYGGFSGSRNLMISDDELANDLNMLNLHLEERPDLGSRPAARSRSSSKLTLNGHNQPASLPIYGLSGHPRSASDQATTPTQGYGGLADIAPGSASPAGLQYPSGAQRKSPGLSTEAHRSRLSVSPSRANERGTSPTRHFGNNSHISSSPVAGPGYGAQYEGSGAFGSQRNGGLGAGQTRLRTSVLDSNGSILNGGLPSPGSMMGNHGPQSPLGYQTQNPGVATRPGVSPLALNSVSGLQGSASSSSLTSPSAASLSSNYYNGLLQGNGSNGFFGPTPITSPTSPSRRDQPFSPHAGFTRSSNLGSLAGPAAIGGGNAMHGYHQPGSSTNLPYNGGYQQQQNHHVRSPSDSYITSSVANGPALAELGRGVPLRMIAASTPLFLVEFKAGRTDLFFCPDAEVSAGVRPGDLVIVEADRGKDLGKVVNVGITGEEVERFQRHQMQMQSGMQSGGEGFDDGGGEADGGSPIKTFGKEIMPKRIYAKASLQDTQQLESKIQDEAKALQLCQSKVRAKKLPMEVIEAEYQWDRRKLTFYFVADRRIDFRELVRELFRLYKTRIWMACLQGRTYLEPATI